MMIGAQFKKHFNQIFSLGLALTVIYIAIEQRRDLANAFKQVQLSWAFAGLGCYGINYLLRALRIKVLLKDGIQMWPDALYTACLHGLTTYLLPFRSGDFALPVLLSKVSRLKFVDGVKVLIKARLLDLCALGVWILSSAMFIDFTLPEVVYRSWVIFGVGLSTLPLILKWIVQRGKQFQNKLWQRALEWGGCASFTFKELFVSLWIWACVGACYYCTAQAIGLPLGFKEVWLLITIQLPLQLIPLQGVANTGNHEGGWIAGLALLGMPTDQGLHFALLSHALLLTYVLALAPAAFLIQRIKKVDKHISIHTLKDHT